jgi:HEPN domain-containing protein
VRRNDAPGTPAEWLDRARARLALARQPLPPGGYWEDLCFMAQQAAELAKAVYQHSGWGFEFVHDLGRLLDGLVERGVGVPGPVQDADGLTGYATRTRYPGVGERVTENDHRRAVAIADVVVEWAASIVE